MSVPWTCSPRPHPPMHVPQLALTAGEADFGQRVARALCQLCMRCRLLLNPAVLQSRVVIA